MNNNTTSVVKRPQPGWLRKALNVVNNTSPVIVSETFREKCEEASVEAAEEAYNFALVRAAAQKDRPTKIVPLFQDWVNHLVSTSGASEAHLYHWVARNGLKDFRDITKETINAIVKVIKELNVEWDWARIILIKTFAAKKGVDPFACLPPQPVFRAPGLAGVSLAKTLEVAFEGWLKERPVDLRTEMNRFVEMIEAAHEHEEHFKE